MCLRLLLKNAKVYRNGRLRNQDVAYENGRFINVSPSPSGELSSVITYSNILLIPGFADVHVHLREPGFFYKETISSGTLAAAAGGYTVVCAMPNVDPPPDTMEHLAVEAKLISETAVTRVYPYGCITIGRRGEELCDFEALKRSVIAFSDDGSGVQSESVMYAAMTGIKKAGGILAAHCEDDSLVRGGYIHAGDYAKAHGHAGICSKSEYAQLERDLKLAKETGCRYHACHVSTKESVELIRRAKREGVDVSCETAPHYLLLCDDDLREDGRFKMNPPIRAREDMHALIEALNDGTIDIIATDHAPHSASEKSRGLKGSAMGVSGLECAFAALYTGLVLTKKTSLERLLFSMIDAPRLRFRLPQANSDEDFAVMNIDDEYTIDPAEFMSKGKATPFAGMRVRGRCELTAVNGKIVWKYGESRDAN